MRIYLRKVHHIQDPEVNSIWNGPKVDGKLNISSSTYSCGVALSSKLVIFEIYRNHSRRRKVARLRVTRGAILCVKLASMTSGSWIEAECEWISVSITPNSLRAPQQSSRWNLMIWFEDYSCVFVGWLLPCRSIHVGRSPVLDRGRDTNFWKRYFWTCWQ